MLAELTTPQLAEWWAYHERNSWTPERSDLRQEVLIHRMLGLWSGAKDSLPSPFWPYFGAEDFDPEEALAAIRRTQEGLIETPDGLKWKEGYGPVDS